MNWVGWPPSEIEPRDTERRKNNRHTIREGMLVEEEEEGEKKRWWPRQSN